MPHRNHLRGKLTLLKRLRRLGRGRGDTLFAGINRQSVVAGDLMDLGSGRCCEADENDDAITARIPADGVDVEIGFPVVNGPKVAGPIYVDIGATHGRDEAWRHWWWTVQRYAIMQ